MKFNCFVTSKEDVSTCASAPELDEVLLETVEFAREGRLSIAQAEELAREAIAQGLRTVLVWDILMTEDEFKLKAALMETVSMEHFSAIRTQCPGAASWVRATLPTKGLHIILENSNHNMPGLRRWVAELAPQRVVLSTQLPEDRLIQCCKELDTQCEILGAGKILLFYSKRHLLTTQLEDSEVATDFRWIYADSASEESASRPFPTIDNEHGTFMYLNKDHFILDKLEKLAAAGMHTVRIDLRDPQGGEHSANGIRELCQMTLDQDKRLDSVWPRPTAAPFFKRNRTDKQFNRMKPQTRLLRDENCLAEVVSVERGEALALFTLREFDLRGKTFTFVAHDGAEVPAQLEELQDLRGEALSTCAAYKVVRCRWLKGVRAGAILVSHS